jgi:hypothetical protein
MTQYTLMGTFLPTPLSNISHLDRLPFSLCYFIYTLRPPGYELLSSQLSVAAQQLFAVFTAIFGLTRRL